MDLLRPDDPQAVAARLVAWHNRHPLARRLSPLQVQSVGYVAVPFILPDAAGPGQRLEPALVAAAGPAEPGANAPAAGGLSLRERAQARAQQGAGTQMGALSAVPPPPPAPGGPPQPHLAPARRGPLPQPAFTEDFIAPLSPRRVARWLARHGRADVRLRPGMPVRRIAADAARVPNPSAVQPLYALTGMVEIDGRRIRPLLSVQAQGPVLGTRLWSLPRIGTATGLAASALLAVALTWQGWTNDAAPAMAAAAGDAPVQVAAADAAGLHPLGLAKPLGEAEASEPLPLPLAEPAETPPVPDAAHEGPGHAPGAEAGAAVADLLQADAAADRSPHALAEAALGASGVAGAREAAPLAGPQRPADVEPSLGRVVLPELGLPQPQRMPRAPGITIVPPRPKVVADHGDRISPSPGARTAQHDQPLPGGPAEPTSVAAAAAPANASQASPDVAAVDSAAAAPTAALAAMAADAPAYALSSRLLRTRAESELTAAAVRSLLKTAGHQEVQVETMPVGDDWRVVGWPFIERKQAEQARSLLVGRGLRMEVVDF